MSRCNTPCLAITLGDPAGIGPEVTLKAIVRLLSPSSSQLHPPAQFVLIGTIHPIIQKKQFFKNFQSLSKRGIVKFIDVAVPYGLIGRRSFPMGKPSPISGHLAFLAIQKAVEMALKKEVDGIVTAPISKVSLSLSNVVSRLSLPPLVGHTEILKKLTRSKRVQMVMLCIRRDHDKDERIYNKSDSINVVLVTRHLPLSEVSQNLSVSKIISAAVDYASVFGKKTKFAVCSLNPHAGDNGLLGEEEKKIISPAVCRLKKMGYVASGPFPSDSVFAEVISDRNSFDCVLAMYHDQAMIPLKVINRRSIVNLTIGLPFIRTSPGHGVAFDISVTPGLADEQPMMESIKFALNNYHLWKKL